MRQGSGVRGQGSERQKRCGVRRAENPFRAGAQRRWEGKGRAGGNVAIGLLALLLFCLMSRDIAGASFHLIACGSGGEASYSEQFADWGARLQRVLVGWHPASQVVLLTETGKDADGISSVEGIRKALWEMGGRATEQDDVFVYLIGHGSFRQQVAKVNVPGPDLSAEVLNGLLRTVRKRRVVVIQGASASAPFINVLSGTGRIICTSTRSAEERNAAQFMGFFVQALEDGSADCNRDGRISVLEACQQASVLTQAWYDREGYIATEHGLLDDNGDGLGTRLSELDHPTEDGLLAAQCFLRDFQVPDGVSPEVVAAYRIAMEEVQGLIAQKAAMDSVVYYQALEEKLVQAARLNREIRGYEDVP